MPSLLNHTRPFEPHGRWWFALGRRGANQSNQSMAATVDGARLLPVVVIGGLSTAILAVLMSWLVPPFSVAMNPRRPEAAEVGDAEPRYVTFDTVHSLQSTPLILVHGEKYRITVVKHSAWKDGRSPPRRSASLRPRPPKSGWAGAGIPKPSGSSCSVPSVPSPRRRFPSASKPSSAPSARIACTCS